MIRTLCTVCLALLATHVFAAGIAGVWKHAEEPGWIEIRMEDGVGTGTVVRNDVYPERVGREIAKGLVADASEGALWRGQVYAERLGEYKDAEVSLPAPDKMRFKVKVGIMSRNVDWIRVDNVPAVTAK